MKALIKKLLKRFYKLYNHLPFNNSYWLRKTKIKNQGKILHHCHFNCRGTGNTIVLKKGGFLKNTRFYINGCNNTIIVDERATILHGDLHIEDNGNVIFIGKDTCLSGKIHLACIEGTTITIGMNCLFSSEITIRTGDSHSILDLSGRRINPSKDVMIADHVWVGHHAVINKGVSLPKHTVVGAGAIVTKTFEKENTVLAGIPAKIVTDNIDWCSKRIPLE